MVFGISRFQVLGSVPHRSAIGFGEPQSSVVSRTNQVVTQMRQTTRQAELVDRRDEGYCSLEGDQLPAAEG